MVFCLSGGCHGDSVYLGVNMVIIFIWGLS